MTRVNPLCISYTAISVFILSCIAYLVNYFFTQYPGNNYFPEHVIFIFATLFLIYWGCILLSGIKSLLTRSVKEYLYLIMVFFLIAFATTAVQFTPFTPIDKQLVLIESYFYISMPDMLAWINTHPEFKHLLEWSYTSLPSQMHVLPIIVILSRRFDRLKEFCFLLLMTVLIGFPIYYFFPTTAPASIISSPYFLEEQLATGLKFTQIHQHVQPSTLAGGLISFPSFHIIWAWLCMYLIRSWKIAVIILAFINTLLLLSCVLLGWHYVIDILGSIIVLMISHYLLIKCRNSEEIPP